VYLNESYILADIQAVVHYIHSLRRFI